jgi:hypothetical protein
MSAVLLFSAVLIGVGVFYYPELVKQMKDGKASVPSVAKTPVPPKAEAPSHHQVCSVSHDWWLIWSSVSTTVFVCR